MLSVAMKFLLKQGVHESGHTCTNESKSCEQICEQIMDSSFSGTDGQQVTDQMADLIP